MFLTISNQKGASYLTVLLVSSAIMLASLAIQQSLKNQKKVANSASSTAAVETLHEIIYSSIQNQENCWATISPVVPGGTLTETGAVQRIPMTRIIDSNQTTPLVEVLADGSFDANKVYINNSVRIRAMNLVLPADFKQLGQIEVEYARFEQAARTKEGFGGKNIKKTIPIVLQKTILGTGNDTCYGVTTGENENLIEQFCNDFGGGSSLFFWDDENQTCSLKNQQCEGQVFVGINANGTANCQNLEDWADLSGLIDTTSTEPCDPATANAVRFEPSGGKMKIMCEAAP